MDPVLLLYTETSCRSYFGGFFGLVVSNADVFLICFLLVSNLSSGLSSLDFGRKSSNVGGTYRSGESSLPSNETWRKTFDSLLNIVT